MLLPVAVLLAGVFAGFLAGLLGIGGGMVIVPVLVYVYASSGFPLDAVMQFALATSLASIFFTGLSSAGAHHVRGAVRWDLVRLMTIPLVLGALAGAWLANWLGNDWLQRLFGLFAVLIAVRMWFASTADAAVAVGERPGAVAVAGEGASSDPGRSTPAGDETGGQSRHVLAGGVIGVASAIFGIGGGSLTVPWLHHTGLRMQNAVATSAACGIPIALAAASGYMALGQARDDLPAWSLGYVHLPSLLLLVAASMPMAAVGARVAHRLPASALRKVFSVLLLAVAVDFIAVVR